MNIEQIAIEVADELFLGGIAVGHNPTEFLRRCLKKLAEHVDMKPVAWNYELESEPFKRLIESGVSSDTPLYTETQLLAAQQKAAEACAKAVFEQAKYFGYNAHAEAVRYAALNKWSEYL